MKLDLPKKITLGVLAILVIIALCKTLPKQIDRIKNIVPEDIEYSINNDKFDKQFIQTATKYDAFTEIFKSETPVIVYGYIQNGINKKDSDIFHKNLLKLAENQDTKYKLVAIKDWHKTKQNIEDKHLDGGNLSCAIKTKSQENLELYLDFIEECLTEACYIDRKQRSYAVLVRNEKYLLKVLQGKIPISDLE